MNKKNRAALIKLMDEYRVSIQIVANILNMEMGSIRVFRSKSGNDITDNNLELLELKLAAKYDNK